MDISCPHCQAAYNVDVPNLDEEGIVDFKCVKCGNVFTIDSKDPDFGKKPGGNDEQADASEEISPPLDDLDAFLDDLIEKEIRETTVPDESPADLSVEIIEDPGDFEFEDLQQAASPPSVDNEETEELRQVEPEVEDIWADIDSDQEERETPSEEVETVNVVESVDHEIEDIWAAADQDQEEQPTPGEVETVNMVGSVDQEIEDLWGAVDQDQEEPPTPAEEAETVEAVDLVDQELEDIWAAADQDQEAPPTPAAEAETIDAVEEPADKKEEEDLWARAFSEQEAREAQDLERTRFSETLTLQEEEIKTPPVEIQETLTLEGDEDTYEEDSYDDEEYEFKPKKKKFGPFSLPDGKTGNLVIAGIFTSLLLILGSVYFAVQTFIPDELANIQKTESEIPEGLTPNESPEESFDIREESAPDKKEAAPQPAAPDKNDLEPVRKKKSGLAEEFAKSKILKKSEGVAQIEPGRDETNEALLAALSPADTLVTLNAILPVAYDSKDIKILSFILELEVTDKDTARRMREALPIYEDIMLASVEKFLSRQFFNDVFYVQEKLQKQFLVDFNKALQGGRVKKTRFREFLVQ